MSALRRNALRSLSRRRNIERGLSSIAVLVLIPGVCAVLGAFTPDIHKEYGSNLVAVIWLAVLAFLAVFAIRLNPTGESLLGLAVENEDQQETIAAMTDREAQLRELVDRLAFETNYSASVRSAILSLARQKIATIDGLEKALHDLASPLDLEGEFIFDLAPSEAWSFAVYLYSKDRDLLVPAWRRKAKGHKSARGGIGREWARGEGHVGKAFVDQRMIITGDAQHPDAEPFSAVPLVKERPYDRATYRSFASVPIGPLLTGDGRPYGVLVATSDRVGRFSRENAGILIQIAGAIASFLITGGLDIDELAHDAPAESAGVDERRSS